MGKRNWATGQLAEAPTKAQTNGQATEFEDTDPNTWVPVDLGPYLRGEITQPKPVIGLRRTDAVTLIYPGREHVVLGDTESGKTWFALGCVMAEIVKGNCVVYIHFEEPDPTSTIERLTLLGLSANMIAEKLTFIAPMNALRKEWITPLVDIGPSLVVHDGVNEAMSLQGAGQDVDGASLFRRLLVTPFTKSGAATLACDHLPMAKDSSRRDAYGTVHKGNALDGARIQLENFRPMGRERRGVSNVYVTKDRPGFLRQHGRETAVPGRTFMGVLAVDSPADPFKPFEMAFFPPREPDVEQVDGGERTTQATQLTDVIWDTITAMKDHTVGSHRLLLVALRTAGHQAKDTAVKDAVAELEYAGRLAAVQGARNAKGYRTITTAAHLRSENDEDD